MKNNMDELVQKERLANRWVAYVILLILAFIFVWGLTSIVGCKSFDATSIERLDELADKWKAKLEKHKGEEEKPSPTPTPTPDNPPSIDQLDYSVLRWNFGGFNGAGAKLDSPRISGLKTDGRNLHYKWDVGLSGWGLSHGDAGAICAVFFDRGGTWVGGKFDWVSTSRAHRELKHVESYNNWPSSGIKLPWSGRVAFVVVSANGKHRSNVLVAEAK